MDKKQYFEEFIKKTTKGLKREGAVKREMDSDKLVRLALDNMTSLPEDCSWDSVAEWKAGIEKQLKRGESTLKNMHLKKFLLEAVELANKQA